MIRPPPVKSAQQRQQQQVNWRHQVVTPLHVRQSLSLASHHSCPLVVQQQQQLWLGPRVEHPVQVAEELPQHLLHSLDWDLQDEPISVARQVLERIVGRLVQMDSRLRHLCLRFRGDAVAVALSQCLLQRVTTEATTTTTTHFLLESLDLRGTHMGDTGCEALARVLRERPHLIRSLHLGHNRISNVGMAALARVVEHPSCRLECLDVSFNAFDESAAMKLLLALETNETLRDLSLSGTLLSLDSSHKVTDMLQCHNLTLQRVQVGWMDPSLRREMEFWLRLNRTQARQCLLKCHSNQVNESAVWPALLAKLQGEVDLLYYFISAKPDLFRFAAEMSSFEADRE